MTFAQSLPDRVRAKAARDAIYSALYGCVPEAVVDSGAIIVIYIALYRRIQRNIAAAKAENERLAEAEQQTVAF